MAQEKQILHEHDELVRAVSRMAHKIEEVVKTTPPVGVIDITPYRDDRAREQGLRTVGELEIPVDVDEKTVVLIDDVIFRGRTIRAAMEAVARLGQAKRILVAVLVDRGARELPIRADIVGKNIDAGVGRRVNVMLEESDGVDQITVSDW